jgi:predicted RNA-binding protein YlqC (UPF0109 family)
MDDLREQLADLLVRQRDLIWGDTDLTDPAVAAELHAVQRDIDRLMISLGTTGQVAAAIRRGLDRQA